MRFSGLQKYILNLGYGEKGKMSRDKFLEFYKKDENGPKREDRVNIITKSLERLMDRGILVGYGVRTAKKWFVKEVKLTARGRKMAKNLQGKQAKLPLGVKSVK
jgi:lipoprotein NlpI